MPRIKLKPKSPEFAETETKQDVKLCEMPGCTACAEHKAPKHRGLDDYYYFCFEHVKEYNKAWNFFSGLSDQEVEEHMYSSYYGDRPTWKYNAGDPEEALKNAARNEYFYGDEAYKNEQTQQKRGFTGDQNSPEHEAMALMGLSPPVTLDEIKTRYKALAKQYHPDLNRNDPKAEEHLKKINMSYTILKLAFEEYKKLPDAQV